MPIPESPHVFTPEGTIDFHVSSAVSAALRAMIDKKPGRLVIDLSGVPYVDSSGLAVLIDAMRRLENDGGLFMLAGVPETVRTILESSRLDVFFLQFPNVDAALAAP
jgi:anti-sigma B factor antagonist